MQIYVRLTKFPFTYLIACFSEAGSPMNDLMVAFLIKVIQIKQKSQGTKKSPLRMVFLIRLLE